jgi:uncharacterized protein
MKKPTRILKIFAVTVVVIIVLLAAASEYFLRYSLHRDKVNYDADKGFVIMGKTCPWIAPWLDSIRNEGVLRDTFIVDGDGKRLHAWFAAAPRKTGNTAVIVHGYKSHSIDMFHIGFLYNHDLQWNILLPDLDAHGMSEGQTIQMGWDDRNDVMRWMQVAKEKFRSDTLVVHGISMGAATTMCVSGDDKAPYVRGFVEDCGYTSVWDEFHGEMKKRFNLPAFPLLYTTSALCKVQYGWSFTEASPLQQVAKCQKPMLFIHGSNDTFVPTAMVYTLFKAKPQPKELWIADGSEHANAYRDHHAEYTEKVRQFVGSLK